MENLKEKMKKLQELTQIDIKIESEFLAMLLMVSKDQFLEVIDQISLRNFFYNQDVQLVYNELIDDFAKTGNFKKEEIISKAENLGLVNKKRIIPILQHTQYDEILFLSHFRIIKIRHEKLIVLNIVDSMLDTLCLNEINLKSKIENILYNSYCFYDDSETKGLSSSNCLSNSLEIDATKGNSCQFYFDGKYDVLFEKLNKKETSNLLNALLLKDKINTLYLSTISESEFTELTKKCFQNYSFQNSQEVYSSVKNDFNFVSLTEQISLLKLEVLIGNFRIRSDVNIIVIENLSLIKMECTFDKIQSILKTICKNYNVKIIVLNN